MQSKTLYLFTPDQNNSKEIPMASVGISAGFPSPADDFMDLSLDLNKELIKNPSATFYARVSGESMKDDGIYDGDLLVIDKSVEPYDGALAVCYVDGDFTLKRFKNMGDYALLVPANPKYQPIRVDEDNDFQIWGIVRYVIKKV